MAEVFISYKSERRRAAEHMAAVLERYGYSVWFDYQLIKGRDFGLQIDRKVREAKAVVALWCTKSVASRWVIEEVDLAHGLGILVPVKIEPCELPVGFRRQDYIDLSDWDGAPQSHQIYSLLDAIAAKAGRAPSLDFPKMRDYEATWRRFGAPSLKAFALEQPLEVAEGDRMLPGHRKTTGLNIETIAPSSLLSEQGFQEALALEHWQAIKDGADAGKLRAFLAEFGASKSARFAGAALQRLEEAAWLRLSKQLGDEAVLNRFLAEGWDGEKAALARSKIQDLRNAEAARRLQAEEKTRRDAEHRERKVAARKQAWVHLLLRKVTLVMVSIAVIAGAGVYFGLMVTKDALSPRAFRDCSDCPEMVQVPAGKFMMGSTDGSSDEKPVHEVTIRRPFAVGKFAVTWLAGKTGQHYRLLTEAEWEYVARAGTTTKYAFGDTINKQQAQFSGSKTAEVGSFPANAWGLHDMHGNVWEWVEDCYQEDYSGAPSDGSARSWNCSSRVLRGGSWGNDPLYLRSANRIRSQPNLRYIDIGFRVARTL